MLRRSHSTAFLTGLLACALAPAWVRAAGPASRPAGVGRPQVTRASATRPAVVRKTTTRPATGAAEQNAKPASAQPPASTANAKRVSFITEDNLTIVAGYTAPKVKPGQKAPIAVLLHMYNSDRSAFDPLIPHLQTAGFAVLALDLRGHGESVGPPQLGLAKRVANRDPKLFAAMVKDVEAAYRWLSEQPDVDLARFVIVGASVGCSVALDYASQDRSVDGVVCLTPGTSYLQIDSVADAQKYGNRPLLLLAAEAESHAAKELGKLVPSATVTTFPGGGGDDLPIHGTRMFGRVPGVEKLITDFLLSAAGQPSTNMVVASTHGKVFYVPESARHLNKENLRWFSSPAEAGGRGLHAPAARGSKRTKNAAESGEPIPAKP